MKFKDYLNDVLKDKEMKKLWDEYDELEESLLTEAKVDIDNFINKFGEVKNQQELVDMAQELLEQRARVGYLGEYEICIFTDDHNDIPNFHIWDKDSLGGKFHVAVKIDSSEYLFQRKNEDRLDSMQSKELCMFLNDKYKYDNTKTNWQHLIEVWNDNKKEVDVNLSMPDYTKLKVD